LKRDYPEKPTILKLSRLLTDYLIQHKELTLEGLGHFRLDPSQAALPEPGQSVHIGQVQFTWDTKAKSSPTLIEYISKETGKMKPLAISDLESFLEIGRQLLNISKPFVMDGIGSLQYNAEKKLEFTQDSFSKTTSESGERKKVRKAQSTEIHFEDNYLQPARRPGGGLRRMAVFALMATGILIMAWTSWFFLQRNQQDLDSIASEPQKSAPVQQEQATSAAAIDQSLSQATPDTTQKLSPSIDSSLAIQTAHVERSKGFSVVLEVSKRTRAIRRYADLREWGHKVQMSTQDSLTFKLSIPIDAPLSDSIRHRDSLSRFFGKKVWIETN
jgi:hypothetical protein